MSARFKKLPRVSRRVRDGKIYVALYRLFNPKTRRQQHSRAHVDRDGNAHVECNYCGKTVGVYTKLTKGQATFLDTHWRTCAPRWLEEQLTDPSSARAFLVLVELKEDTALQNALSLVKEDRRPTVTFTL